MCFLPAYWLISPFLSFQPSNPVLSDSETHEFIYHAYGLQTLECLRITQGASNVSDFWPYCSELQSQRIWERHPGISIFWLTQGLQFEEYFSTLDCPQKGSTSEKRELCASLTHSETFYKLGEEMIPRPIFLKIWADFAFCSLYEDRSTTMEPFQIYVKHSLVITESNHIRPQKTKLQTQSRVRGISFWGSKPLGGWWR